MKFRLLLPALYIVIWIVLLLGMVLGAGNTPQGLDFLFYVINPPCYLLDLVLPPIPFGLLLNALICFITGILTYFLLGLLLDRIWAGRRRRSLEAKRKHQT